MLERILDQAVLAALLFTLLVAPHIMNGWAQ